MHACVPAYVRACVRACVGGCVRACARAVRECVRACVCMCVAGMYHLHCIYHLHVCSTHVHSRIFHACVYKRLTSVLQLVVVLLSSIVS